MQKPRSKSMKFDAVPLPEVMKQGISEIEVFAPVTKNGKNKLPRVLAVTSETSLALSRALILQRAGFHVISVSTPEQVEAALDLGPFDVFVVGHPIPKAEREQIVGWLRGIAPNVPILEIHGFNTPRIPQADSVVESSDSPSVLVSSIHKLLHVLPAQD
jgi:hypothetical protein